MNYFISFSFSFTANGGINCNDVGQEIVNGCEKLDDSSFKDEKKNDWYKSSKLDRESLLVILFTIYPVIKLPNEPTKDTFLNNMYTFMKSNNGKWGADINIEDWEAIKNTYRAMWRKYKKHGETNDFTLFLKEATEYHMYC